MSWILSIDGGGALGIGPANYLMHAEVYADGIIPDAYAGTSVGALLVALAASGRSWGIIQDIFYTECPKIFEKPSFAWRMNPWRSKYDGKALQAACKRYFGDLRMNQLTTPTFLTAFDFKLGRPKVFDHQDSTPVWYAILCSASAPTYFPIVDDRYGDGGLIANNPAMVGIAGVMAKLNWNIKTTYCLSLGTNGSAWVDPHVGTLTKIGWLKPLLATFMTGNEELATFQAQAILGQRHIRVEHILRHDMKMDDVAEALARYGNIWYQLWQTHYQSITDWLWQRKQDK